MATPSDDLIVSQFESFQKHIDVDQNLREIIQESAKLLEQTVRLMMTTLQGVHLESGVSNTYVIIQKTKEFIPRCSEVYSTLSTNVPPKGYYKFHEVWRSTTQRVVFCLSFIEFLESGKLASRELIASQLSLKTDQSEGFHLDLEDYLHGLLQLVSELSRFAVNSAASGDYERPVTISQFVNEVNAGFRLLNFKNDSLRKHYDCLKYDLKKIEEIVYDLSIRGLKRTNQ